MRHRSTLGFRAARTPTTRPRRSARRGGVLRIDPARLLLGCLVTIGIAALLLAVPVVSGKVTDPPPAALQSPVPGAQSTAGSVVVMGEDGTPLKSASRAAGRTAATPTPGAPAPTGASPVAGSGRAAAGGAALSARLPAPSTTRVAAGSAGQPKAGGGPSTTRTPSSSSSRAPSSSAPSSSAPSSSATPTPTETSGPTLPTGIPPIAVNPSLMPSPTG